MLNLLETRYRNKKQEETGKLNIRLFIALSILLAILLMKKYDLSFGELNVDSIYDVVYHNEDFSKFTENVFFFDAQPLDNSLTDTP